MLHGNGSGYTESEAYGNAETRFLNQKQVFPPSLILKKIGKRVRIGNVYPYVCIYMYIYILNIRFSLKKLGLKIISYKFK